MNQAVKFYQTGTFTVGNRLLAPEQRTVQASIERNNSINSGHRACQGCGEALGARYAIDAAMRATGNQLIAASSRSASVASRAASCVATGARTPRPSLSRSAR